MSAQLRHVLRNGISMGLYDLSLPGIIGRQHRGARQTSPHRRVGGAVMAWHPNSRGSGVPSPMTLSTRQSLHRRGLLLGAAALALPATRRPAAAQDHIPAPVSDPSIYTAYIPTASKPGQFFWYTCEFDAAWAVLKTFGIDAPLDEQLAVMGIDYRIEPISWRLRTAS